MAKLNLNSVLQEEIMRYIEIKESLYGKNDRHRRSYLRRFDEYCTELDYTSCSKEAVIGWCEKIETTNKNEVRRWVSIIRDFACYLQLNGHPDAYIIPDSYRTKRVAPKPYLFSQDELDTFFYTARNIKIRNSPWEWQALAYFGLMYSCGLRTCEVRHLMTKDVDFKNQSIDIIDTKDNFNRRLYITDDITVVLEECDWNTGRYINRKDSTFFVNNLGNAVGGTSSAKMFKKIWNQAGLPLVKDGRHVRAYDLRHHFAYANIERWAAEGKDVNAMLPYLQRYMGHSDINSTLYYVHTSPDFMAAYAGIVYRSESLLPEVGFDD